MHGITRKTKLLCSKPLFSLFSTLTFAINSLCLTTVLSFAREVLLKRPQRLVKKVGVFEGTLVSNIMHAIFCLTNESEVWVLFN